jgi:hypothetical protein
MQFVKFKALSVTTMEIACYLLGYGAFLFDRNVSIFRTNILPPSSGIKVQQQSIYSVFNLLGLLIVPRYRIVCSLFTNFSLFTSHYSECTSQSLL